MSGADTIKHRARRFVQEMPGRRVSKGGQIPDELWHTLMQSAQGVTLPVWGRHPTPEQIQWLYDSGYHEPHQVREAFGQLPHPHAPGLKVDEYPEFRDTYKMYVEHNKR